MKQVLVIAIFSLFLVTSCYYDNESDLYPVSEQAACDTSGVTYTDFVYPVIQNHCNNCHSDVLAPSLGGNISLENYEHIKYNVDAGSFQGSIEYDPDYSAMPIDGQLDDCTIQKINAWIMRGAPND